jgi:hypothetical protein
MRSLKCDFRKIKWVDGENRGNGTGFPSRPGPGRIPAARSNGSIQQDGIGLSNLKLWFKKLKSVDGDPVSPTMEA